MNVRTISLVAILAYSLTATTVFAAESSAKKSMYPTVDASQKIYKAGEDELKARLVAGKDKPFYRQKLEKMGYAITAVNSDTNDYLEYEVIKGGHSYEVQVDFKNGVADKVDIANNVWEAKSTKEALKKKDYTYVYPIGVTSNPELVSERTCGEAWREEMIKIEQDLGIGHDRHYYRPALENMGYKVTSVNDFDFDYIEYEVIKGDASYEVQVHFDEKTKMSTKVDAGTNWWEADATEKAKGEK